MPAIKILPQDLGGTDANFAARFKQEARTMARLSHPGIVPVHDAGETAAGLLYFVMEFIEGTDVARMVKEQGRLQPDHALAIIAHVCYGSRDLSLRCLTALLQRQVVPGDAVARYLTTRW